MRLSYLFVFAFIFIAAPTTIEAQQAQGTLVIEVRSGSRPVEQAEVAVGTQVAITDERGEAVLQLPAGDVEVTIQRYGFKSQIIRTRIVEGSTSRVSVEFEVEIMLHEEITVTATRIDQRIEDVPLRVEVLGREEIEEKALMTPGNIAEILRETSGVRVQVISPSLGAANVRIQGLRGRYTQILADGLPLYGGQTGAIGLLQIPPMDLGQVEVIKGVASAFYGASALGGVINLVSRRPEEAERELLINRTTRNGTDAVFWLAEPSENRWGYTVLGGGHFQGRADIDGDGWADLAGYSRGVVRPRFFWNDDEGRSLFATVGIMVEDRKGGTIATATVPDGTRFPEELTTRRFDAGFVGRFVVGSKLVSVRGSAMTQRHRHQFGEVIERDRHETWFGEATVSGARARHTWMVGSALQGDLYRSRDVPRFDYTYAVPGLLASDDYTPAPWITLAVSGRLDVHNEFGAFFNPRASMLLRLPRGWVARASTGTGFFAPTPFTEETEAVGLSRVLPLRGLDAERGRSASLDVGWSASNVQLNANVFGSIIRDPVVLQPVPAAEGSWQIVNAAGPTKTFGSELLARFRRGHASLVLTYTFVNSTELDVENTKREDVPLTPQHTAGAVGMWEDEARGRVGIEILYTGRQRLDANPYQSESEPYVEVGVLVERRVGPVRLFVNAENLTDRRQTRYAPLVRPNRHFDGRWTVDAWAPMEGRIINGGVRFTF